MIVFLDWNEVLIEGSIKMKIFFSKSFNITVLISNATRSAKGPRYMSVPSLETLDIIASAIVDFLTYMIHHNRFLSDYILGLIEDCAKLS